MEVLEKPENFDEKRLGVSLERKCMCCLLKIDNNSPLPMEQAVGFRYHVNLFPSFANSAGPFDFPRNSL